MFLNKRKVNFLLALLTFIPAVFYGQVKIENKVSLINILQEIEIKHKITFNYLEKDIENIVLSPPEKGFSLIKKLEQLKKKTNLSFDFVTPKLITITVSENDKIFFCGYVYDKNSNKPIENAILIINKEIVAKTSKEGYFNTKVAADKSILISGNNYKTLEIKSKKNGAFCDKIYLEVEKEDTQQLNEVLIYYYLTNGIAKTKEGYFFIQPKNFGLLPGLNEPDILKTIQQIPGLYSTDESVASINIRGGTHDQNLFLWNGIRMYQTGHFFGLISTINPYLSNKVKIYKNGSSAFYGDNVSGVIDIESNTDLNINQKQKYSVGLNMINADLYTKQQINKHSFLEIAGRKSISKWLNTPTYKQYFNKAFQNNTILDVPNNEFILYKTTQNFDFYDATLKYFNQINTNNKLTVDYIIINDNLEIAQKNSINNPTVSNYNTLYQKNNGINVTYEKKWNSNNSSKLNAYHSTYELDAENDNLILNSTTKQENSISDFNIKIENIHHISNTLKISNGYQYNQLKTTNLDKINTIDAHDQITNNLNIHAAIIEVKYSDSISRIDLTVGLRTNYIEQFRKATFEPRLQLNFEATAHVFLNLLGEFKSQHTFQNIEKNNDYFGIEKRRWILSNNTTNPIQRSKQISINATFKKNNWLLSVENFYKFVNGITTSEQGFQNQLEFVNLIGSYKTYGYEFLVQKKINNFNTWIAYTYNDNKYNFPDLSNPVFTNNFEIKHLLLFATIYNYNRLKVALGAKWHSGKPETTLASDAISNNFELDYNSPNNKSIGAFFQLDASALYNWKSNQNLQYSVGCSITNILNRKNEINEFSRYNASYKTIDEVKNYALMRTINLNFRVEF